MMTKLNRSGSMAPMILAMGALSLVACNPPHPKPKAPLRALTVLDCPSEQGDLQRKSAAADGKSCLYATEGGDQVELRLVAISGGDARAALDPIEAQLKTELPTAEAKAASGSEKDKVNIDLPGLHIHASGDSSRSSDGSAGHEAADGRDEKRQTSDRADVQIGDGSNGGVTVNANDGGAQIRVAEKGSGVRATYILASETPGPHGYKAAGYEARGPSGGPIVVAVILAKSDDHDNVQHDVRRLLTRNVGG